MTPQSRLHIECVPVAALVAVILGLLGPTASALVVKSNSLASYSYELPNAFVPGDPLTSAAGSLSSFSFLPSGFTASASGATNNLQTATVTLDMAANPGLWFDGSVVSLDLNAETTYSLAAPAPTSTAQVDFSAQVSLDVTGVNGSAYVSGAPLSTNLTVTPPSVAISGPVSFANGTLSGSLLLDINTIKLYFGIGASSKVTSMRLQITPSLYAQSFNGSATAQLVNFDVANQVVPEPSTYALLVMGAGAVGVFAWRRRRA